MRKAVRPSNKPGRGHSPRRKRSKRLQRMKSEIGRRFAEAKTTSPGAPFPPARRHPKKPHETGPKTAEPAERSQLTTPIETEPKSLRLQKYMARRGVGSRRKCEQIILAGRVMVNGTVVTELGLGVRITPNQDLLLCHVPLEKREWVDRVLAEHGVWTSRGISQVRQLAMACPALPTCGLAMTDAERVLPVYIEALEEEGLGDVDVIIRMSGCPNSCSRPPTAEIGIYGFGKNGHVIQVGGSREGTRVGKILYDKVSEEQMIPVLKGIVRAIRDHKPEGLPAGEFLHEIPVEELRRLVEQPAGEFLPQMPVERPA